MPIRPTDNLPLKVVANPSQSYRNAADVRKSEHSTFHYDQGFLRAGEAYNKLNTLDRRMEHIEEILTIRQQLHKSLEQYGDDFTSIEGVKLK